MKLRAQHHQDQKNEILLAFGRRLFAAIIDWVIFFIVHAFALPLTGASVPALFLLSWLYFSAFEASPLQASPGKIALGLRVRRRDGARPGLLQVLLRYPARLLSGAFLGVGYFMMIFDPERRMLHDKLTGTRVGTGEAVFEGQNLLLVARRHRGRLSPVLAAAETGLAPSEARRLLDEMCITGICRPEPTEDGRIEYHFPDFLPGSRG